MAGDWIKMRSNLWDDPRVSALCDATGQPEATVIGGLYWLWSAADQHTEDGFMPGLTASGIDRKSGVRGLGTALLAVGWIEDAHGGINIIRFDDHNGVSAKRRCMEAQRKAKGRSMSASHADNMRTESGHDAPKSGHRAELEKEKRREEKEEEQEKEPAKPKVFAQPEAGRATKKCPKAFVLSPELVAWAAEKAAGVDPHAELEKMRDHTFSTARTDWAGTWRNWMRKAADSRPGAGKGPPVFAKGAAIEAHNQAVYERLLRNEGIEP